MSETTPDGTPALHADPAPPLAALTGAHAAIYTHLTGPNSTKGATAAELSLATGLGRSTAGKALAVLEDAGLAYRQPGGFDGRRRLPDHWYATTPAGADAPAGPDGEPAVTPPAEPQPHTPSATDAADKSPSGQTSDAGPKPTDRATNTHPDDNSKDSARHPGEPQEATGESPDSAPTALPTLPTVPDTTSRPEQPATRNEEAKDGVRPDTVPEPGQHHTSPDSAPDSDSDDTDDQSPAPPPAADHKPEARPALAKPSGPSSHPAVTSSGRARLAPGALRQTVLDHLRAHPNEAFTATAISRVIGKSSGAIANALVTLTTQAMVEQVDERPRRYRAHPTPQ
jgi:hypothetical protein